MVSYKVDFRPRVQKLFLTSYVLPQRCHKLPRCKYHTKKRHLKIFQTEMCESKSIKVTPSYFYATTKAMKAVQVQ